MQCPTREQLEAYLRGTCDEAAAAHIENCSVCQAALSQVAWVPDEMQRQLRQAALLPVDQDRRASMIPQTVVQPPRRLGGYELIQPIGGPSGQGIVWRGREIETGRPCAVKVLRPDRRRPDLVARFRREIGVVRERLKDPHIVLAYDDGEQDGEVYLVMELLDGQSLAEVLQRHGRLSADDACEIGCQAAIALYAVHRAGLVHRDVKPGNLFVTREGKVKLLDLGLVKLGLGGGEELSWVGMVAGTPGYMSPEQRKGEEVGPSSDLYSLGCVLYRVLSGRVVDDEAPVPLQSLCPGLPVELERIVNRLLEQQPANRFATAAEVIAALRLLLPPRHDLRPRLPQESSGGGLALQAELDVLLWDRDKRHRSIREPATLPLRTGDLFQVEVRVNRPAYVYVLWLNTEGQVQALYPWLWPAPERPCDYLLLPLPDPTHGEQPWPLEGPPGLETVVLVVDEVPRNDLVELLALDPASRPGVAPLAALGDLGRCEWFVCRQEEFVGRTRGPNLSSPPVHDPVMQMRSFLRRRLGPRARLVQAVSFVNAGAQGGSR